MSVIVFVMKYPFFLINRVKYFILVITMGFLFCGSTGAIGQVSVTADSLVQEDALSAISVRSFSSKQIEEYRHSSAFQYERATPEVVSWWDRIKQWFWQLIGQLFKAGTETSPGQIILLLVVIALLLYAAIRMSGIKQKGFLEKKSSILSSTYLMEEEIHAVNFDQLIDEAVYGHNYRLAVRLWYLKTLKKLSDKEVISWKPGKTNYAYLTELAGTRYVNDFRRLTRDFENCWYGERPVVFAEYEMLKDYFSTFNQQLS